jgi:uncharacterized membrane protein YdjX (TVP38/TMEM64 family)
MKRMWVILLVLCAAGLALSRLPLDYSALLHGQWEPAVASLRQSVASAGWGAYLAYGLVFTFLPLGFVPVSILCVAGGLIFPWYVAVGLIWAGCLSSAALSFLLTRTIGRGLVERVFLKRLAFLKKMDEGAHGHGFKVCLLARFLPFPYVFPGYAAGLSRIRFKDFILGTAVGMLPWSFFYAFFAHSLTQSNIKVLGLTFAGFALLFGAGYMVQRKVGFAKDSSKG